MSRGLAYDAMLAEFRKLAEILCNFKTNEDYSFTLVSYNTKINEAFN